MFGLKIYLAQENEGLKKLVKNLGNNLGSNLGMT